MFLRTIATGILLTACAFAQMSSFPKPSYFRETFNKPNTKVELQPPVRLQDFVKDGKLELSLKDYLALVMANNTNVQTQFLTLETSRNGIISAYGRWDPQATFSFTPSWATKDPKPSTWELDSGNYSTKSRQWPISMGFSQTLSTGQSLSVSGGGSKTAADGGWPSFSSNLGLSFTQPLIQNRGSYINRVSLMVAQSRYKGQGFSLRNSLMSLINSAEVVYWNAISARETVQVQTTALETAQKNWDFIQKQFSLGAISYLDTYNPQQALAASKLSLAQAQFNLRNAEDAVRQQLAADLDTNIRTLPLNLTEPVDLPTEAIIPDREATVQQALAMRPDLKNLQQNLDIDDLNLASAKNGLLPNLSFRMGYSGSGYGSPYGPTFQNGYTGPIIPGGLGDSLSQLFGWGNPTYTASLTLTLPIRSRSASAAFANAMISKKQDSLSVRNSQQSIRLSVLNAITSLESAKESLGLAKTQRDFSELNYKAMVTKYELGTEIQQNVVKAQQDLAQADLGYLNAKITLQKALLSLYLQTGELLDKAGIVVDTPAAPSF